MAIHRVGSDEWLALVDARNVGDNEWLIALQP